MTYPPEGQQPQPPAPYSPHPYYPAVYAVKPPIMPHAVWSVVLAAIGLVSPFLPFFSLPASIAGVILGHIGLSKIAKSPIPRSGRGIAITGLALGYMAIVAGAVWVLFYVSLSSAVNAS